MIKPSTPERPAELPESLRADHAAKQQEAARVAAEHRRMARNKAWSYAAVGAIIAFFLLPKHSMFLGVAATAGVSAWLVFTWNLERFRSAAMMGGVASVMGFLLDWPFWPLYCCTQVFIGGILGVARESQSDEDL